MSVFDKDSMSLMQMLDVHQHTIRALIEDAEKEKREKEELEREKKKKLSKIQEIKKD